MIVRPVRVEDAAALLELRRRLDTEIMIFEPGERTTNVEDMRAELAGLVAKPNSTILVAEAEALIGHAAAHGGMYRRNRHVAWLVLGVLREHAGHGIGAALLAAVEAWAAGAGVHRLELNVMAHNERAIRLYRRVGFVAEGVRRNSMRVNGAFVDEVMMAKLL